MKRYLFVLCAAALACTTRVTPAFAQASALGSSFPIYSAFSRGSAVAYDTKNHVYLVVSAYGTVSARFVSADGALLPNCISSGVNFAVGGAAFGHFPRVGYSPDANGGLGGFMVTWHEGDSVAGGNAIHARAVSLSGCLGADRIISNTINGSGDVIGGDKTWWEGGPAIAYATKSQRWLVVWRSIVSADGQFNDVNGRVLSLSGNPLGFSPVKVSNTNGYEDNPSVAYNPNTDEFLVTYSGEDSTSPFVAAKRVTSAGIVGPAYVLARSTGTYITDTTFIASTGNYLSVWHQAPGGATGYIVNGITGAPEGSPIPMSTRFTANDAMSVAYNAMSGTSFLVSHDQLTSEDGGFEISAAGVPSAGFGTTNAGGKGNYYPRIAASSADKRWMMVTANDFTGIYGQFISSTAAGGVAPPPPAPTIAPLAVTGLPANVVLPVKEGTAITWTAITSGGSGPLTYQFMRYTEGVGWSVAQPYSSSNTYTWFPSAGTHAIQVWVRNNGSSAAYDAYLGSGTFVVLSAAPKLMSVALSAATPVPVNTPITFTANATGASVQYKFFMYTSATGWRIGQDYSSNRSFTWYPPTGLNAVQVWVRTAGASVDYQDWMATDMFSVSAAPVKVTGLVSNAPNTAPPSFTQTWTAYATGGGGPLEYKFLRFDVGANTWYVLRDWAANNQASWTPGLSNSGWHAIQVWVRVIGSSSAWEDWKGSDYFLVTGSGGLTLTSNRSLTGLKVGDLVTWTANVIGGSGPWEYQFAVFDGTAWRMLQAYSGQNTFSWYPPSGTCALQVWIRAAGSHAYWERYTGTGYFVVNP
jgi:hypothetical protein